ncbi:MAG: DMT family transporter [Mycobacteriales bacterium]|nr:MAG: EamA family transporter [Pseudonocardiales bacterium]
MSRRAWALFVAMCVIWGIPYLLIRVAVRDLSPGTLVFARTGLGALLLLPVALSRRALWPALRRWRPMLAYTVVEVAVPWLLLSDAETKLSSSLTGLLVAAVPLVGVLIARLLRSDDAVDRWRVAGLALGIVGVAALLGLDIGQVHALPIVEMGVVTVGYAVGPVILTRRLSDLPAIGVVTASLAITALAYLPVAILDPPHRLPATAIASVASLALFCTAVAFLVFFALIAEIGPARATVITYVNPAVAILLGVLLLGEDFTTGMAVGFPLILAGSVLAARRHRPAASPAGEPEVSAAAAAQTPQAPS